MTCERYCARIRALMKAHAAYLLNNQQYARLLAALAVEHGAAALADRDAKLARARLN